MTALESLVEPSLPDDRLRKRPDQPSGQTVLPLSPEPPRIDESGVFSSWKDRFTFSLPRFLFPESLFCHCNELKVAKDDPRRSLVGSGPNQS